MSLRVLFDVTRLLWRNGRGSPTGIDRVVHAYARWLIEAADFDLQPVAISGDEIVAISLHRLKSLLQPVAGEAGGAAMALTRSLADGGAPFRWEARPHAAPRYLTLLGEAVGHAAQRWTRPAPKGDIYLNVAHSGLHKGDLLGKLARRGLQPVVMVHDLIPITHPEFCAPGAEARHRRRIDTVLAHARLIIANSEATASDLTDYAKARGMRLPPILPAPLGVETQFLRRDEPGELHQPYFVCVGTIEARKNLAFLLTLWRRLAERMGSRAPHLVLVGRRGWENEAVIDHLERSHAVTALVHEVGDLSDDELAQLMNGACALVAPSLAEGFDLPLIEALALGVPAIASDIPAHRELAAGATLIDPVDGAGWISAIEAASVRRPRSAPTFTAPTWDKHFALVGDALLRRG